LNVAQEQLRRLGIGGWLIADFRGSNVVFSDVWGHRHTTRRAFYWIPAEGEATLLVHAVDAGSYPEHNRSFTDRREMVAAIADLVAPHQRVAMEYSPLGELPAISYADAGIVELVRSLGPEVVSSAEVHQYTFARWPEGGLDSHRETAAHLVRIVGEAFEHAGGRLGRVNEYEIQQFILDRFAAAGLNTYSPPIVAVNAHSGDPHFAPTEANAQAVGPGDWLLIDLWARAGESLYGDITWVGYAGGRVPEEHRRVFETVTGARDAAFSAIEEAFARGEPLAGWQVDQVARRYIAERGYGAYFKHRLGHSLGRQVHAGGVNLDDFETHDTRPLIPGIGVTIEPGIYLPAFGVRSEVDVYIGEDGPVLTTAAQREVVRIG
jgi:Xaa-Pro aminopeptidase